MGFLIFWVGFFSLCLLYKKKQTKMDCLRDLINDWMDDWVEDYIDRKEYQERQKVKYEICDYCKISSKIGRLHLCDDYDCVYHTSLCGFYSLSCFDIDDITIINNRIKVLQFNIRYLEDSGNKMLINSSLIRLKDHYKQKHILESKDLDSIPTATALVDLEV
jgi:hypothetical protein